ncbi:calcium uptake protein 1, mitochondrial-like isoform X2 [Dermatophagoides pteronyssinus]|uniref:Calcium uptake protein 1, mitochondrial-like isoform X2 n=2 Tax=Dermatophagoides pteronyssinus TaxID=6956 RepID=A0A6P6XVT9_DERPT|nr:calcium uptake protein 1, mitochondrial-like isoform X2 [Dermatophagoides pteronyssinus]KAH9421892.1 Calcium uptake protein 1, mitochondrial [Dermatophagoides pteronyssinus]
MILSKPLMTSLKCHRLSYLVYYSSRPLPIVNRFQNQSWQFGNQRLKLIDYPFKNGSNLFIIKRDFRPPNSYVKHKESYLGQALDKFLLTSALVFFLALLIDFRYIWDELIPPKIRNLVEKPWSLMREWAKNNLPRRARGLAQNECRSTPESETSKSEKNVETNYKILDSNIVHNLMAVFNFNANEIRADGFRNKRIIEYENRIRHYSNPDKIFRYFATVKIVYNSKESEILMTPDDFLRALTPGIQQPEGLGLDQFKVIDMTKGKQDFQNIRLKPDSIFYKLSHNGLINFPDFLFLLTVISVSPRNFEIAFRMFDLNDDGEVEYEEFAKVQNAILAQTSVGKKMGKCIRYKGISSAVSKYFFGNNLEQRLTINHFLHFQETLQKELLTLEFERKNPDPKTGKIAEIDFADLLVAYALFSEKKRLRMNKRVMKKFVYDHNIKSSGVSFDDYLNFFRFLQHINDVDIALAIYHIAGASIDQATLKHVAKTVAHVHLSDHLIDLIFTIFDDDEDGQLSHKEFIAIMKERLRRGLSKPKDTGFMQIMHTVWKSLTSFE